MTAEYRNINKPQREGQFNTPFIVTVVV